MAKTIPAAGAAGSAARVSLRRILLPPEHGAWGFVTLPALLGLLAAPTLAGACLGLSVLSGFLARHPLKLALADRHRGRRYPRTAVAERAAAVLGGLSAALLGAAALLSGLRFAAPLLLAFPALLVSVRQDFRNQGRSPLTEVSAPVALGAVASAVTLAAGWPWARSFALWAVLVAWSLPSVLYVRTRLRRQRGETVSRHGAYLAQALAVLLTFVLAALGLAPRLAVAAMVLLALRAVAGLSSATGATSAPRLGFTEMAFGIVIVALVGIGLRLGL